MKFKLKGLTNFQIQNVFDNSPYAKQFHGCFSRDTLPKKIKNGAYIINLDVSTGAGSHWVSLFSSPKQVIYFDPFGIDPSDEIVKFMKSANNKNIMYSTIDLQNFDAESCAYWSILFIESMLETDDFNSFIKYFSSDTVKNEKTLEAATKPMKLSVVGRGFLNRLVDRVKSAGHKLVSKVKELPNKIINNLPFEAHSYDYTKEHGWRKMAALGPGSNTDKRTQLYNATGNHDHIYINDLDKLAYAHDQAYNQFRDVEGRKASDKVLVDGATKIYKDPSKNLTQRINAYAVNKLFKAKTAIGVGVKRKKTIGRGIIQSKTKNKKVTDLKQNIEKLQKLIDYTMKAIDHMQHEEINVEPPVDWEYNGIKTRFDKYINTVQQMEMLKERLQSELTNLQTQQGSGVGSSKMKYSIDPRLNKIISGIYNKITSIDKDIAKMRYYIDNDDITNHNHFATVVRYTQLIHSRTQQRLALQAELAQMTERLTATTPRLERLTDGSGISSSKVTRFSNDPRLEEINREFQQLDKKIKQMENYIITHQSTILNRNKINNYIDDLAILTPRRHALRIRLQSLINNAREDTR